ncbi:MAG: mandelate racemase/muconate lactonizing enzyme family protein [Acidobacteriota bacterium]
MKLDRRLFVGLLAGGGAGALAGCDSTGQQVQAVPDQSGLTDEELIRAAETPILRLDGIDSPLIIDSLRLLKKDDEYFVHVRSKDGAEGISVTNSRASYLYPILQELVFPFFIGKDARKLESELLFELYRHRSNYKLQGIGLWCPQAWTEFALLDLLGRVANRSMGEILGGTVRSEVPFYIASGRRDSTPEEEVEYLQSLVEETGAGAVKFRVGGRMSRNADSLAGRTENLIRLSRKVLGDSIDLHADANSSYDPEHAVQIGRLLEEVNAVYFEEPCPFDHLQDTKKVTDALTIPVALGEQEYSQRRFLWIIRDRMADIVQPDLQYYGGMIRSIRVARMAALAKMPTTVHISGGFGFIYMLHFASVTLDIGKYQEYKRGLERYNPWFTTPVEVRQGKFTVPGGPGVGIADIAAVLKGAEVLI